MEVEKKLLELFGGTNFKIIDGNTSIREFKDKVRLNEELHARIEAMGEQHVERIQDLICFILAERLYPLAIKEFGDASKSSLSYFLKELLNTPQANSEWLKIKQLAMAVLENDNFNKRQLQLIDDLFNCIPN